MTARMILTAVTLTACCFSLMAGDLTGKVTLKGAPPPERDITPLKNDPSCGPLVQGMPTTKFYVVAADGGLADVVVVVKGLEGRSTGPSSKPAIIDQVGCLYTPQISAVQTGQKILVKNSDPVFHNVNTMRPNPVEGNPQLNLAQMPNGPDLEFVFPKEEDFLRFKCDVHPWMFAWVTVVDHPWFALTGPDGTFKIPNVPPGKYTVEARHRRGGTVAQEVEITDAGATANFVIELK